MVTTLLVAPADQRPSLELWLVIFTAALALVGLLQFITFVRQIKWMRQNVKIAEKGAQAAADSARAAIANVEIAEKTANAARDSARAASKTVTLMRTTSRKDLRARVFVLSAQRIGPANPVAFSAEVTIKNFGKIPAYRCTCFIEMIQATNPAPTEPFPNPRRTGQEPRMVLPPGGEIKVALFLHAGTFQHNQHNLVMAGSHAVYIYGEIQYRDGFKHDRVSKFVMRCCGSDYSSGRFSFCERGNTAN